RHLQGAGAERPRWRCRRPRLRRDRRRIDQGGRPADDQVPGLRRLFSGKVSRLRDVDRPRRPRWSGSTGRGAYRAQIPRQSDGRLGLSLIATAAGPMSEALLELHGVSKTFGPVTALSHVDLTIGAAEAVGLIGDNGAGKSTLVKILSGLFPPTTGKIRFDRREVAFASPFDARAAGIEMIYQDLALCGDLDVAANVFLGRERRRRVGPIRLLDRQAMQEEARRGMQELGVDVAPDRIVGSLSGGQPQLVAVARALQFRPRLLLLD